MLRRRSSRSPGDQARPYHAACRSSRRSVTPTALASANLVAPEFQITNEPSVVAYVNYMSSLVSNGAGDTKADYTAMVALAGDSAALIAEVNALLCAGLSAETLAAIKAAVDTIAMTANNGPANRVGAAIVLALASPEFLVQK